MRVQIKESITLLVIGSTEKKIIKAGEYELAQIENPDDPNEDPWLIIQGSKLGASEGWWRTADHVIFIEE